LPDDFTRLRIDRAVDEGPELLVLFDLKLGVARHALLDQLLDGWLNHFDALIRRQIGVSRRYARDRRRLLPRLIVRLTRV
jgi:hypothetical protein